MVLHFLGQLTFYDDYTNSSTPTPTLTSTQLNIRPPLSIKTFVALVFTDNSPRGVHSHTSRWKGISPGLIPFLTFLYPIGSPYHAQLDLIEPPFL